MDLIVGLLSFFKSRFILVLWVFENFLLMIIVGMIRMSSIKVIIIWLIMIILFWIVIRFLGLYI